MQKLFKAAERQLADAKSEQVSNETRFDAAYNAINTMARAALAANGYRTSTSVPGHHQTALQSLPKTIGVESGYPTLLVALSKRRHVVNYEGGEVSDRMVRECIEKAGEVTRLVRTWIQKNRRELLEYPKPESSRKRP
jgi:HEPN domain-containing protein